MSGALPDRSAWPDAVVIGLELNGLGLSRTLAKKGVTVRAVDRGLATTYRRSRAVNHFHQLGGWTEEALIEGLVALGKTLDRPAVLFQTKDEGVIWCSRHRAELDPYFRVPLPPPSVVDLLMSKGLFSAMAKKEGWPLPLSWSFETEDELRAAIKDIPFPCILKPQVKTSLFRRQKLPKAFKPTTPDELIETYRLVAQFEPEVVVSEWIPGRDDQLVSCRGYWDADARPVMRFIGRKLLQWPVELGNMAVVEPAPPEWWAEAMDLTQRVFDQTGMHGIGAMEYKRRPDGRLVILEPCTSRTVYSHEVAPLNGFDLPWACFADMAFGIKVEQPGYPDQPLKLFDGIRAKKSAKVYLERGLLTAADLRAIRSGRKADMLFRWDDPLPWIGDTLARRLAAFRK
ncbi:MAG: hypothetical protein R2882_01800 [Gemmatimonadales bacterium]